MALDFAREDNDARSALTIGRAIRVIGRRYYAVVS